MGLFAKNSNRSKPSQVWVCDEMKFIGKMSAEEQKQFLHELSEAKSDAKTARSELETLEHAYNAQSRELEKLRSSVSGTEAKSLLWSAAERIKLLEASNKEKSLRLSGIDDVVAIFKAGRQDNGMQHKFPSLTDEIQTFLNKS